MFRLMMLVLTLGTLVGCASQVPLEPEDFPEKDDPLSQLNESAEQAQAAMTRLAKIDSATAQSTISKSQWQQYQYNQEAIPPGFDRQMSLHFVGNATSVMSAIATMAGYTLSVEGEPPAIPLVVNIQADNEPLIKLLRSVDPQLGAAATVRVYGASKVLQLIYNQEA